MRSTVFQDGALGRQAGRFVWLAMDTEKAKNATFKTKYAVEALPSFFVVDPSTDTPALRWVGGATTAQMLKILDDGAAAVASRGKGLEDERTRADALYAAGKNKEAAHAYQALLAKAPKGWSGSGRATESLLFALSRTDQPAACARLARDAWPRLAKTSSTANVAAAGLGCALDMKADEAGRAALIADLAGFARRVLADRTTTIVPDERSSVYDALTSERAEAKDEAGKKQVATDWAAFLEREAAKARTPDARAVFDSHRLGAYLMIGAPEKAVAMLQASERDLPDDYNPPARLTLAYKAQGRYDEAVAASGRALTKVYGPRRILVLRNLADVYTAKGDSVAARKTLEEALSTAQALPEGQRSEDTIASLRKKLAAMPEPAPAAEPAPQAPAAAPAPAKAGLEMTIEDYEPRSTLVVPQHPVTRAKYPFIDVHNHQDEDGSPAYVAGLVKDMDALNLQVMVNLSGGSGEELARSLAALPGRYPKRFVVFANLDFKGIDEPDWPRKTAAQFEADIKAGAKGLKIFKNFGMTVKDSKGSRVHVDDPRLDPVFEACGRLGVPVLIHTAEPASFFEPQDRFNERWLELKQFPRRARPPDQYPSWETLVAEQWSLFARHPKTKFICAHLGWMGGNLARLGGLLDRNPNVYTEIGAVLAELGRQPRFAREFFEKHQTRVMFGKDTWAAPEYHVYFRVLETADEYFDYYRKRHAFWKMYGLELPDAVLQRLYFRNALDVIPGIDRSAFPR